MTANIKEVKDDYPDIDTKMPSKAKTGAERKLTYTAPFVTFKVSWWPSG